MRNIVFCLSIYLSYKRWLNAHNFNLSFKVSVNIYSDVNYLSATAPPAAAEWQSLLRPLRGREPEGMWNLLSIVREMLRRNDSNAVRLLEIITDEVLQCEQVSFFQYVWWKYKSKKFFARKRV